jgi:P pilus assembly chaperone PapD
MKTSQRYLAKWFTGMLLASAAHLASAAGMVPETSVLLINEADGEATMTVKNTDPGVALLHTQIVHVAEDQENLIVVTPPIVRVEPNEMQMVRFILTSKEPLKTERLARVIFDGIPDK